MTHSLSRQQDTAPEWSLLVVEDDPTTSELVCMVMERHGIHAVPCLNIHEAAATLRDNARVGAMLIDIGLPDGDGIDLIRDTHQTFPKLPCFVLTAKDTVDTAVLAMKAGAVDYFTKPFDPENIISAVKGAMDVYVGDFDSLDPQTLGPRKTWQWKSPAMLEALDSAKQAAKNSSPVLIRGAHNTGKGAIARWIHENSSGKNKPFVTVNPATMTPAQVYAELFGTAREGASRADQGRLGKTKGGTVYIENVTLLDTTAQAALLAWLNGNPANTTGQPSCKLITSSAVNLDEALQTGGFRRDLWYAISIYQVEVPCLADRTEDLPLLCENIITRVCVASKLRRPSITRKALEMIIDHTWPGNLSELHNVLEHAVTHTNDGLIGPDDLPRMESAPRALQPGAIPLGSASIDDITKASLVAALESCQGNRRRAAQRLKVSLRTVYNMIQRYELAGPKSSAARHV